MEVTLTNRELRLAHQWGTERAFVMQNKNNKAGYAPGNQKTGFIHTAVQSETLAIAAEIAGCKLLGFDYMNPDVYTAVAYLDANGNLPASCKQPDVAGVYEIRRVERHGYPLRMWKKDVDAKAYVIKAHVEHMHLETGFIKPTGLVTFEGYAWAPTDYYKGRISQGVSHRHALRPIEDIIGVSWTAVA